MPKKLPICGKRLLTCNLLFFFILIQTIPTLKSQNYYNLENSVRFADYLFQSRQYDFAAEEYERVVFLDPADDSMKFRLIQTYRFNNNYDKGINCVNRLFTQQTCDMPNEIAVEYVKLMLLNQTGDSAYSFLNNCKTLNTIQIQYYTMSALLLKKDWNAAFTYQSGKSAVPLNLTEIATEGYLLKYKKPAVAATLSAIIPGSGKMYAKRWKDGLYSLLIIAANVWQSYRGFEKYGSESAYGWIFGGLAIGFYSGNIYGSYKETVKYNNKLDENIYKKAQKCIFADF